MEENSGKYKDPQESRVKEQERTGLIRLKNMFLECYRNFSKNLRPYLTENPWDFATSFISCGSFSYIYLCKENCKKSINHKLRHVFLCSMSKLDEYIYQQIIQSRCFRGASNANTQMQLKSKH